MDARAARDDAKRSLAANVDPSAMKRERMRAAKVATGNTFEAVARQWHDNWKDARTPYYAGQILRRLEADVFPAIGRRPIAELEPPELLDMLRKVEKRGVNETARRLKQLVGQVFRFGVVTGRAERDPSTDLTDALRATGEPQRHRAATSGAARVLAKIRYLQRRAANQTCFETRNVDVSTSKAAARAGVTKCRLWKPP
jgi:integrase